MSASQLNPAAIAAIFFQLESGRIAISAGYAAAALILYDFFLSFSFEVDRMWRSKKSLVFILFMMLRYATIFYQMTFSMSFFLPIDSNIVSLSALPSTITNNRLGSIIYVEQVCFIFSSSALSGIFALRTFAIYQRNWFLLVGLLFVASVKVFISAADFFVSAKIATQNIAFRQFGSCSEVMAPNAAKWNTSSAALRLTFDTLVLMLTLTKTLRTVWETRKIGMKPSYSYYFLRDGLLYYLAIEILLLFTVIFNQIPSLAIRVARVVIILQTSLAPILAQRLVLNLRSVQDINATHSGTLPPLAFAHGDTIGNIGAPLQMDDEISADDHFARDIGGSEGIEMVYRATDHAKS
ncbi:hypothetical protein C8J56DRAFT_1162317 [Mycena floridula]|nr:hypothetical protein C8J56DRAFT_1162317 [Mycena floridula]